MSPLRRAHLKTLGSVRRLRLGDTDTVVVGVSGGPDSTCLLDLLANIRERPEFGFNLHAAHLIHDFRDQEKYVDAQFVRDFCQRWALPLTVEEVDVAVYQRNKGISSFEQAARDLRYEFLGRVAKTVDAKYVAVAHTADDLAETVLLHIARGSGIHGLRGMDEVSGWPYPSNEHAPSLWRPLLAVRRADNIAYCRNRGIGYRDDTTNYLEDFARNRVRMNLMPALAEQLNPGVVRALGRLARTASTHLDFLEACADEHWPTVAADPAPVDGILRLRRDKLAELHPALQALILRRAWISATGTSKRLTEGHLLQMASFAAAKASRKTAALPWGYTVRSSGQWLEIYAETADQECPYPSAFGEFRLTLPWGPIAVGVTKRGGWEVTAQKATLPAGKCLDTGDPMETYFSATALAEGATVRTWQPGDRIQPLGMSGHRKVQDLFTDAGIPRDWRFRVPLVVTPRGVAWVMGVRIADWAAVQRSPGGSVEAVLVKFQLDPQRVAEGKD